ncbi:hypothetical protein AMK59_892, partial [Oryctes borbonicus]
KQLAAHYMLKSLENGTLITVNQPPSVSKLDLISDNIIIDKIKQLNVRPPGTTPNISKFENKHCDESSNESKIHNQRIIKSIAIESSASFVEELSRYNLSYSIDVMARNPFVLSLKFANDPDTTKLGKNKHGILTLPVDYNAIGHLNEYTAKNKLPYPTYSESGYNSINEFVISCSLGGRLTEGAAPIKKAAKQLAAHYMLKSLENRTLITVNQPPSVSKLDLIS